MYSMKEACALTGMTYENLKFYCKEGLVPNVKRDSRNYRVFDDHDIKWIQSLGCLRNCGLSIAENEKISAFMSGGRILHSRQKRHPLPEKRSTVNLHAATAGGRGLHRLETRIL